MSKLILTEEQIKKYLDNSIALWRELRDAHKIDIAQYYIDAFQSVRFTLFDELLPENIK